MEKAHGWKYANRGYAEQIAQSSGISAVNLLGLSALESNFGTTRYRRGSASITASAGSLQAGSHDTLFVSWAFCLNRNRRTHGMETMPWLPMSPRRLAEIE
jgi:hypothetical protein